MEIPVYKKNIYSKKSLLASDAIFKELRELGEVVYLSKHKMYALTSFDAVQQVLENNTTFISGKGITANHLFNPLSEKAYSTLTSDGDTHLKRKGVLMRPLTVRKMKNLKETITRESEQLVQGLLEKKEFDIVTDFARHLPLSVVANLIGITDKGQEKLLDWAFAGFNTIGPMNWRSLKSMPAIFFSLSPYAQNITADQVQPGGWAAGVFKAVEAGHISLDEGKAMIFDYIVPSLDTTILSAGYLFWALAKNPQAYQEVRSNPELIPSVVNEVVRLSSPIRGFTRHANEDISVNGYPLKKGSRVLALYTSANLDDKHYPNAATFDIHRNPTDQMGWGHGVHKCAGMHLARLELEELLRALCKYVDHLEVGTPTYIVNNVLQGLASAPGKVSAGVMA